MKKCSMCNRLLDESNFTKRKNSLDGLRYECKNCRREYRRIHPRSKEKRKKDRIKYRENHKNYIRKYRENINHRLATNLRYRLWAALKGKVKSNHTFFLLGCSIDFLKKYLENKFKTGMNWKNYGRGKKKWNIDHIIPCVSFDLSKSSEQHKCFHYINLQPLWMIENIKKGSRIL